MRVFTNYDNGRALNNPGMGWVIHHSAQKGIKDSNEPDRYDNLDNVALLSQWSLLEPEEGRFCWDDLDSSIKKWTENGKKMHFRISTDPMIYNNQGEGVPDWVYEKYKVPYKARSDYGVYMRFPDYLNPVYQEKLTGFLNALAERYGGNEDIEIVDLRGYGEWGEWHSGYAYESYAQRSEALRSIIEIWSSAFKNTSKVLTLSCSYEWRNDRKLLLHAPRSYEEYLYWQGFDYALSKNNISFRRDGVGGAVKLWDSRLMQEYYYSDKKLPMICEFFINYTQGLTEEGVRGYHIEDAIEEALMLHPNYMMLMWDSVNFYEKAPQLIEYGLKRMGYRLLARTIELPDTCRVGDYITIMHSWINLGVGRCFKKYCLNIRLAGQDGSILTGTADKSFDPTKLSENKAEKYYSNLLIPGCAAPGLYQLQFALEDNGGIRIKLPMDRQSPDGFYTVGEMTVE